MNDNSKEKRKSVVVPIWEKYMLTVEEAAKYFGIGEKKKGRFSDYYN